MTIPAFIERGRGRTASSCCTASAAARRRWRRRCSRFADAGYPRRRLGPARLRRVARRSSPTTWRASRDAALRLDRRAGRPSRRCCSATAWAGWSRRKRWCAASAASMRWCCAAPAPRSAGRDGDVAAGSSSPIASARSTPARPWPTSPRGSCPAWWGRNVRPNRRRRAAAIMSGVPPDTYRAAMHAASSTFDRRAGARRHPRADAGSSPASTTPPRRLNVMEKMAARIPGREYVLLPDCRPPRQSGAARCLQRRAAAVPARPVPELNRTEPDNESGPRRRTDVRPAFQHRRQAAGIRAAADRRQGLRTHRPAARIARHRRTPRPREVRAARRAVRPRGELPVRELRRHARGRPARHLRAEAVRRHGRRLRAPTRWSPRDDRPLLRRDRADLEHACLLDAVDRACSPTTST